MSSQTTPSVKKREKNSSSSSSSSSPPPPSSSSKHSSSSPTRPPASSSSSSPSSSKHSSSSPSRPSSSSSSSSSRTPLSSSASKSNYMDTLFCPECHNMLSLPDARLLMKCNACHRVVNFIDSSSSSSSSSSAAADGEVFQKISYSTRFTAQAQEAISAQMQEEEDLQDEDLQSAQRAKVSEPCAKCRHHEQYFYTLQLRSVDEGQSVFYECCKCGNTTAVNS